MIQDITNYTTSSSQMCEPSKPTEHNSSDTSVGIHLMMYADDCPASPPCYDSIPSHGIDDDSMYLTPSPRQLRYSDTRTKSDQSEVSSKDFFKEMEENIYKTLACQTFTQTSPPRVPRKSLLTDVHSTIILPSPGHVEVIPLDDMICSQPPPPRARAFTDPQHLRKCVSSNASAGVSIPNKDLKKPVLQKTKSDKRHNRSRHTRMNSGGTIFLDETISTGDINNMIECLCICIQELMNKSIQKQTQVSPHSVANIPKIQKASIFDDDFKHYHKYPLDPMSPTPHSNYYSKKVPSLQSLSSYCQSIQYQLDIQRETIVIALVYTFRIKNKLPITPYNWKSLLFSILHLAHKVWNDSHDPILSSCSSKNSSPSYSPCHYIQLDIYSMIHHHLTCTPARIQKMERALLGFLEYSTHVTASEYAKYYFWMRSKLATTPTSIHPRVSDQTHDLKPLDMERAKRFQLIRRSNSGECLLTRCENVGEEMCLKRRVKSMDFSRLGLCSSDDVGSQMFHGRTVCLEQIVRIS